MGYFDRNSRPGLEKAAEENQSKTQKQTGKKTFAHSAQALMLVFAVIIVTGTAYLLWPLIKGGNLMEKASKFLNGNGDVSLTCIMYSEDNPMAIVNNKTVHEGDVVGEVKVVKIHIDGVELETAERKWSQNMPLSKESVRSNSSSLPELLVLMSERCPACKEIEPILNHLNFKYSKKFKVSQIDVWENREAGERYDIRATPTQIFYDSGGKEVFRHVGFYSEADILGTWKDLGIKL